MSIISWIVLGFIAGWIAGMIMGGHGYGLLGDVVVGILGAIIGGWLTSLFFPGVDLVTGLNITSLIVSVVGAIVLVAISRLVRGKSLRPD